MKILPVNPHLIHRRRGKIVAMETLRSVPFGEAFLISEVAKRSSRSRASYKGRAA
jgi:hypothetical protein